jgi:GNAT superfamily N-acetyltransferase
MTSHSAGFEVREIDLDTLTADELDQVVALANLIAAEREPRHSDFSTEEFLVFSRIPGSIRHRYAVFDDASKLAAYAELRYRDDGSNAEMLRVAIGVDPAHRRKGIARSVLEKALELARELGRTRMAGETFDTVPAGVAFAATVGAEGKLDFHANALQVQDLDLDLLRGWVSDGPRRAEGYSVRIVEGMYPDELLEGIAHLYHVLERDMPTPEGHEPRIYSPEFVTEMIGQYLAVSEALTAVAIHDESGAAAGMSQLARRHHDPSTWIVSTTMVDPEHRGHALGKWLKAAVNLEALERWPGAVWEETGNAFTNAAMLAINHAMGFRHEFTMTEVHVDVESVERYLGNRST